MNFRVRAYHYKVMFLLLLIAVPPFLIANLYNMNVFLRQSITLVNSKNENEMIRTGAFLEKTLDQMIQAVYSGMTDRQYAKTRFTSDRLAIFDSLGRFAGRSQYNQYFDQIAFYNETEDSLLLYNYGLLDETKGTAFESIKTDIAGMDNYQLKVTETRSVLRGGAQKRVAAVISKLPAYEDQGYLLFTVDVEKVYNEFLQPLNGDGDVYRYYLTDEKGRIVYRHDAGAEPARESERHKDRIVQDSYKLGSIGWKLVGEVNVSNLYAGVYRTRDAMIALLVVVTLLIVGIIQLAAKELYKPVKTILASIAASAGRKFAAANEFDFIRTAFEDVVRSNSHLHHRLNDSERYLQQTLLLSLIRNRFARSADVELYLRDYRTNLVVVLLTDHAHGAARPPDADGRTKPIEEALGRHFDFDLFDEDGRQLIALIRLPQPHIDTFVSALAACLDGAVAERVTVSVGGIYPLERINHSYIEALYAYNMSRIYAPEQRICCYNKLPADECGGSAKDPTADELELAILHRNEKAYTDLLHSMFSENRSVMEFNGNLYLCISLLIRLCDRESVAFLNEINDVIADLGMMNSVSVKQFLLDKFRSLPIETRPEAGDAAKSEYVEKVERYFAEHYASNFSMDEVAEHVGVTRQYISQLFKKRYSTTMVDYLSQYRVEQAKRLLAETQMKVTDIGTSVGFNNKSYFTKVFKLSTGITPSDYRELALSRNPDGPS
ncbi:MAG: helix-turn-helix domain-containing protein [Paenibacillaceae bacterium]|nr:helix-turn-helix domain-containing protein [Paenibacillaceae bacterium]